MTYLTIISVTLFIQKISYTADTENFEALKLSISKQGQQPQKKCYLKYRTDLQGWHHSSDLFNCILYRLEFGEPVDKNQRIN